MGKNLLDAFPIQHNSQRGFSVCCTC